MTTGKDIASFFENGTTEQFEYCYKLYPQVLKLKAEKRSKKPQELIRLDEWYQNELPKLIKTRGKDAHMVYDELVQTMKWKQSRGKFYPQLSYLVKVNTPRAVMQETKKAFRKLPNLEQAITALSNLKGVGTTMASALLAAAAPDSAPFMADECLMAIPEIEGIDYTTKEYLNFVQHIQNTVKRLNTEVGGETPFWSPHRVELALWAHYVANDLSPELLDQMPVPGACGGVANTNGKAKDKLLAAGGEDTNDADDESLSGAGRGETNNTTATESETENENTNPPTASVTTTTTIATAATVTDGVLQDGDSNFVSNDSTSQEPIIDENTTQTTATTSTDDGEVGTPLASDSESNLDAPLSAKVTAGAAAAAAAITGVKSVVTTTTTTTSILPKANNTNSSSSTSSSCGTSTNTNTSNTSNNSNNCNKLITATIGNGNGTLLVDGVDSLDGDENNSCLLRSSVNATAAAADEADASDDEELDDEDEDDHERLASVADESSSNNSNSRGVGHNKSVTSIIGGGDGTSNDGTNMDNDSTLSSAGIVIGQKRALAATTATHCGGDMVEDANSSHQPDLKKIRSD